MKIAPEQFERILRTLHGSPVASDKRRAERFPVSTAVQFARPVGVRSWNWSAGLTHDISELGLGLITTAPAERGQRIAVKLPDGADGSFVILCNVAHCRKIADGLYALGLAFAELPDEDFTSAPLMPASGSVRSKPCCDRAPASR